ncbi:hypothetical protein AADZ84_12615 [Colwelliaceae bacterium MEBiC 14330]
MKKILSLFVLFFISTQGFAEPTSKELEISQIRPYNNSSYGAVYIYVTEKSLCDTSMYRVDLSLRGSELIYSAALSAMMAGKKVKIEIDNNGCANPAWRTKIQSLYVVN